MTLIASVDAYVLKAPQPEREFWISLRPVLSVNELLVRIRTDDGFEGVGLGTYKTSVRDAAEVFRRGFHELVLGQDATRPESVWETTFRPTFHRVAAERSWSRTGLVTACCAIDVALWDIVGKVAGLPLFRLFGGYAAHARAYAGGGYYRPGKGIDELQAEMGRYLEMGHRSFKMKIGALELQDDLARISAVREVIGGDCALMVDVNGAWTFDEALQALPLLAEFNLTWLEEPLCWADSKQSLADLRAASEIPIADGHGEQSHLHCAEFVHQNAVDVLQFDATSFGGITHSRKLAHLAELNNLRFAPHHDPHIHAHFVASSRAGLMVESHADPERDPLLFELFGEPPQLKDGVIALTEAPGLGFALDERVLSRYGNRVN